MSNFNYDKIRNMEYDPERDCYVGEDGDEFHVTRYSDGTGYKYDYYDRSPYNNNPHNSTHVKSDLNENWTRRDNDRDNGTKTDSSGKGCYLTTACMQFQKEKFNDKCFELETLRWFRDKFVSQEDIKHYYDVAPNIVENINKLKCKGKIYNWIYSSVVTPCVRAIKSGDYEFAYNRYKNSVIALEEQFINNDLEKNTQKTKVLRKI